MTDAQATAARPHIVVISLDTLGDLVLRQPLFSSLADAGRLTVLARAGYAGLLPFLEPRAEVVTCDVPSYEAPGPDAWAVLETVRGTLQDRHPDVVVSAPFERTYIDEWLLHTLTGAVRVGFTHPRRSSDNRETLLHHGTRQAVPPAEPLDRAVDCPPGEHETARQARLVAAVLGRSVELPDPVIRLPQQTRTEAEKALDQIGLRPRQYVIGGPAGTANVPLKAWPAREFAGLVDHLWRHHRLVTLLTGSETERPHLEAVAAAAAHPEAAVVWSGGPDDLPRLLGLLAHARAYVGNDTGPMHFAAALGLPVLARFGGGHWPRFLPLARRSLVITRAVPCFGCEWSCWHAEPLCLTWQPAAAYSEGADWLLGSEQPERRVQTGAALDPLVESLLASAARSRRGMSDELFRVSAEATERLAGVIVLTDRVHAVERETAAHLDAAAVHLEAVQQNAAAQLEAMSRILEATRAELATLRSRLPVKVLRKLRLA